MKVVGLMVAGQGEAARYLKKPLDQFKSLCDDVVIALNGEDIERDRLIKKYGFWSYRDDREWGKFQPTIKTELLSRVVKLKPDWVIPLDADEEIAGMDKPTLLKTIEELPKERYGCFFYFVDLWDDVEHYNPKFGFWNIRLFQPVPHLGLQYLKQPVHCGLAPPYAYAPKYSVHLPFLVRHYGLMKKEDREKKIERYNQYDPRKVFKSPLYYEWLQEEGGGRTYNEESVIMKIRQECQKQND